MIPRRGGTGDDFGRERPKKLKPLASTSSTSSKATTSQVATIKQTAKRKVQDSDEEEEEHGVEYLRRKHHFIRTTIRTDYQPDICKDYKETGFCGFGDSCKFLHDRSDYKAGWQLDQEFAKGELEEEADDKYLIKDDDEDGDDGQGDDAVKQIDGIPVICVICRKNYMNPVVTKCKHYFCINCAEKESNINCFICKKPTSGIFKNASKVVNSKLSDSNKDE